MKNIKGKNSIAIVIAMFIIISTNLVCKAQVSNFAKAYVDSNTYSYVTSATASSYSTTARVMVTNIFKADGSNSNYKQVYCKVNSGIPVLVTIGSYYKLGVPSSNRGAGKAISLYAMGHDPSLDCRVTGIFDAN